ncbi:hypothetical protein UT300009_33590 [Paraclostridium bifermentans]
MILKKQLLDEVILHLSIIKNQVYMSNKNGLFDINTYCENLFCELLNIVYDLDLENLNNNYYNFPAIDLGDYNRKICFQVTSTNDIKKIRYTVDKFKENELDKYFDSLYIFILGVKRNYKSNIDGQPNLVFNIQKNIIDIGDLSIYINKLEEDKINEILNYLRNKVDININKVYYSHDKNLLNLFNESIRKYIKILLDHDFSIEPTNLNLIYEFDEIISEWSFPDRKFSILQLEQNKLEIIESLSTINSYLKSPIYFKYSGFGEFIIPVKDPERKIFNEMKDNTFSLRKNIIEKYNEINSKNI